MNTSATQQSWSQTPEQVDPMMQMNDGLDDFSNLFDLGDLDLVDSAQYGALQDSSFNNLNDGQVASNNLVQDFNNGGHEQYGISQKTDSYTQQYASDGVFSQSYNHNVPYQSHGKQGYSSHQQIPPTPNSLEMHGRAGRFSSHQIDTHHQAIPEPRHQQLRKDDAIIYTPMASPSGTPQYNMAPEFTVPGAYFSPLTSPMLHAQNPSHPSQYAFHTATSSNATSPLDASNDVDMIGGEQMIQDPSNLRPRKSERRKAHTPRIAADPLSRVKRSPISKAVKRKSATMLSSMAPLSESGPAFSQSQRSNDTSQEEGSISPEPLSEASMGPPPRPGSSAAPSPALAGRKPGASPAGALGNAATPKSLLSMRGPQSVSQQSGESTGMNDGTPAFEDIQLPEAADSITPRPSLAQIHTQIPPSMSAIEDSPITSSRKTPKLGPLSTPSSTRPVSTCTSPSAATPVAASTPGALLNGGKPEPKPVRGNKKRGSMSATSSNLVSPALRPRISPSIKPLLPEGSSLNSQTHALLLASKSNYQNLLEGNHLPGVNYPDSLSTGLTSKRTSHKVAEQGRRNRINEALKEMQALLPPRPAASKSTLSKEVSSPEAGAVADGERDGDKEDAAGKSSSSKAATVESANEYIRKLQRENAALLLMKKEHEELKRRMAMTGGGGGGEDAKTMDILEESERISGESEKTAEESSS